MKVSKGEICTVFIYLMEINYYESEIMFYTVGVSVIILQL